MPLTIYPATAPKVRILELVQHAAQALDGQYEARVDEAVEELSGGVNGLLLLFGEGLCIEGPGGWGGGGGGRWFVCLPKEFVVVSLVKRPAGPADGRRRMM